MSNSSGIRAGRAYVELSDDDMPLENGLQSAQKELSRYAAQVAGTQQKIAAIQKQAEAPFQAGSGVPALRSGRVVGKAIPVRAVMKGSRWRCRRWLGAHRANHRFKFNLSRASDTGSPAGQSVHRQLEPCANEISGWLLNLPADPGASPMGPLTLQTRIARAAQQPLALPD